MPHRARVVSRPATKDDRRETEVMMEEMMENLLTAQEAATILGTNDSNVRILCEQKRIAAVKKGFAWIIYKPSVEDYMRTKSRRGRPPSGTRP